MGLHAEVNHFGREVNIAIEGTLHKTELQQLEAMIQHFQDRGCNRILFDIRQSTPPQGESLTASIPPIVLDRPFGGYPLCEHI